MCIRDSGEGEDDGDGDDDGDDDEDDGGGLVVCLRGESSPLYDHWTVLT
jgi:hypothetical protein